MLDARAGTLLAQMLEMIGSDRDGEALNAARLANDLVRSHGLRWRDIFTLGDHSDHVFLARRILQRHGDTLPEREIDFLQIRRLSTKQKNWLDDVAAATGMS